MRTAAVVGSAGGATVPPSNTGSGAEVASDTDLEAAGRATGALPDDGFATVPFDAGAVIPAAAAALRTAGRARTVAGALVTVAASAAACLATRSRPLDSTSE